MDLILEQELYPVALSLATTSEKIRSTNKAQLRSILQEGVGVSNEMMPKSGVQTCTIIDGMALVRALGKPPETQTFVTWLVYLP